MSIYSGFATRTQEQTYDQLAFDLLQVLSRKILKAYNKEPTDQLKFTQIIKDIFMKLSLMEKQKYLQPNLSNALYDIMEYFIQKDKQQPNKIQSKTPTLWVKIQKKSDQIFTNDTQKIEEAHSEPRKEPSRVQSRLKTPSINPQRHQMQKIQEKVREKPKEYTVPIRNKFNMEKNSTSRTKQRPKKHVSLRQFEKNQMGQTMYKQEPQKKDFKCPHCHEETISRTSRKPKLQRNQRSQSLQRKQKESSRIIIPELVKEYIDSTNHMYMRHFRRRKVRNGPEFY